MTALLLLSLSACETESYDHFVRATLDDGQVMAGTVETDLLFLETGMGTLEIPIDDVGEVEPVEGGPMEGSGNHVNVWLRNGSELRGRWADPELTMSVTAGDHDVRVELPMNQLERFQTPSGQVWEDGVVVRVTTRYGDDFLVDAEDTQIEVINALGSFSPYLDEVKSLAPISDPEEDWRVELWSGTVLIGPLATDALDFSMPMGPEIVTVPLADLVSIDQQDWGGYAPAETVEEFSRPRAMPSSSADWYDASSQRTLKKSL